MVAIDLRAMGVDAIELCSFSAFGLFGLRALQYGECLRS